MASNDDGAGRAPTTKVGRLIDEYDLGPGYGAQLEADWTAEGGERKSLRDLAEEFNVRILAATMERADVATLEGEVQNIYRLLTDDEVTAGMRTEVENRLERNGIDVDDLESDFVTYQAVRSYLQNDRGAEYEGKSAEDRLDRTRQSIERLRSRLVSVSESNLETLRETDQLTLDEFRVFASVNVLCEKCGSQYPIGELFDRGGCDCERDAE